MIETPEALAALPFLSIVRERFGPSPSGVDYGGVWERRTSGWHCIAGTYVDAVDNGREPRLPVHLLYDADNPPVGQQP